MSDTLSALADNSGYNTVFVDTTLANVILTLPPHQPSTIHVRDRYHAHQAPFCLTAQERGGAQKDSHERVLAPAGSSKHVFEIGIQSNVFAICGETKCSTLSAFDGVRQAWVRSVVRHITADLQDAGIGHGNIAQIIFEGRTTFEGTFGPWSDDKRFLPFPTTEPFEEDLMVVTHDPSDFLPPSLANRVGHYIVTPHGASVNHGGLLRDYEVFRRMVLYRAISAASQLVAAGDVDNGKGGVDLTLCLNVAFESVKAEVSPRTFTVLECPPNITELFCPSQEMNVVLKGRRLAAVHGERTVNKE